MIPRNHPSSVLRRRVVGVAGGMSAGEGRALVERLDLTPDVVPGSDAVVRRPHVWVSPGQELPAPGVVVRQARTPDGSWIVKVAWTHQDPQRPREAEHHLEWLPADQVKPA